jgi:ABC-type Fe3+-hydroxamate transport system substrate-binding protein
LALRERGTGFGRRFLAFLMALAAAAASAGAPVARGQEAADGGPDAASTPIVVIDDLGRRVEFERPPCRIVSLIPAATEVIYAVGAEVCLIGRSAYDDYPPRVEAVPNVGRAIGANVERVVDRRPDLVLLIAGSDNARSVDDFQRLGVPSLVFQLNRLEELRSVIERLGRLLGREAAADSLWRSIDGELDRVAARTADVERPVVYYDIAYPPPITIGRGSYLDSLIVIAGGRNAFHDVGVPSPTISLEAIAVRDPDLILFPVAEEWDAATHPSERPLWSSLRAVRTGNVRRVEANPLHRLGPRIGRAVWALAEVIHPGLFDGEIGADGDVGAGADAGARAPASAP